MKPINAIAASAVVGISFITLSPVFAKSSTCKFESVPADACKINHRQIKSGWKDKILNDSNGTKHVISREMRGKRVKINLYADGQRKGSFHSGICKLLVQVVESSPKTEGPTYQREAKLLSI